MKKIKEYLSFFVDKKTLSHVIPFHFTMTSSIIYMILIYMIMWFVFGYEIKDSENILQMIQLNFYTIFSFIGILIGLYFILKLGYKLGKYIFRKCIEKKDITKIKSFFIFLYGTGLYCFFLFLCLTIGTFFDFSNFSWCLFSWTTIGYNLIILGLSIIICIIELIKFEDNTKLRNLSLYTIYSIISFIIFYALIVFLIAIMILYLAIW